jgi:hypothetical protein
MRSIQLPLLLIFTLAALTACAARPAPPADPQPSPEPATPARLEILAAAPAAGPLDPRALSLTVPPQLAHLDTLAPDGPTLLTLRQPAADGRSIRVEKAPVLAGAIAPDLAQRSTLELLVSDTGDLALARSIDPADEVSTTFTPPMTVLPAGLTVGQSRSQTLRMVVRPLASPDQIRTQGQATRVITYTADERLRVPAGEFNTRRIHAVLTAKLGTANVTVTTDAWYTDALGLIAEQTTEVVKVFGINIRQKRESWVLQRADDSAAAALKSALPAQTN